MRKIELEISKEDARLLHAFWSVRYAGSRPTRIGVEVHRALDRVAQQIWSELDKLPIITIAPPQEEDDGC